MNEWKPEVGEMILVSDIEEGNYLEREYVWGENGKYYCINPAHKGELTKWCLIKPIPKKKYIEFTAETYPKGVVFVQTNDGAAIVVSHHKNGVSFSNGLNINWSVLLKEFISTDGCITWVTAGLEVDCE